jgi:hypothetical protein
MIKKYFLDDNLILVKKMVLKTFFGKSEIPLLSDPGQPTVHVLWI